MDDPICWRPDPAARAASAMAGFIRARRAEGEVMEPVERSDAFRDAVAQFCDATDGRPFPSLAELGWKYVEGLAGVDRTDGSIFCSMLVTMTYQSAGLLPATPPANSYCPTDLSSQRPPLPLTAGSLEVDQPIDMTGVPTPAPPA